MLFEKKAADDNESVKLTKRAKSTFQLIGIVYVSILSKLTRDI